MSLFGKIFSGGEKVRRKPCEEEEGEKLQGGEELLVKKKEFLKKKIDQELVFARRNCRVNRRVALQALRRKKWYEKHLKYVDCAVEAVRAAHEQIDCINKVNDLIKDITEEQDVPDAFYTSMSFKVEFDEDELLAELERLEKTLDESFFERDRVEERAPSPKVLSTVSLSHPAKTEEDEVEDGLEYLRRWASDLV